MFALDASEPMLDPAHGNKRSVKVREGVEEHYGAILKLSLHISSPMSLSPLDILASFLAPFTDYSKRRLIVGEDGGIFGDVPD